MWTEQFANIANLHELLIFLRLPLLCWFAFISLLALALTVYDKSASWKRGRRSPERVLLTVAFLGGALVMYVTMQIIRHKTQHANFMIPLPLFMLLHLLAAWAVYLW